MEPCSICGESGDMEGWGGFEGTFYCHACWEKWWNRVCLACRNGKSDDHFDFIEVGTSDWGTVSQYCAGDFQSGSWLAMEIQRDDLRQSRGLSVEAVKEHLDRLPELAHVKKVAAAMDEHSGEGIVPYTHTDFTDEVPTRRLTDTSTLLEPDRRSPFAIPVTYQRRGKGTH